MKTLVALLLTLITLPALADPVAHYGRGPSRELVHASRHLEDAAERLLREVRSDRGRSEATSRSRELAEAARDFRRLVARNAPPRKLHEAFHRVEHRKERVARQLLNPRLFRRQGPIVASLREVGRASAHVEHALERQRYAWRDGRGHDPRRSYGDRHDAWAYR